MFLHLLINAFAIIGVSATIYKAVGFRIKSDKVNLIDGYLLPDPNDSGWAWNATDVGYRNGPVLVRKAVKCTGHEHGDGSTCYKTVHPEIAIDHIAICSTRSQVLPYLREIRSAIVERQLNAHAEQKLLEAEKEIQNA